MTANRSIWIPLLFCAASVVLCAIALINTMYSTPQRFSVTGMIPCLIGAVSFLYINKTAERKTNFLSVMQMMNVLFIIFPFVTLLYFLTVL
ncbi:hypothetical protein CYL18_01475 [Pradoshia eiseniae]|uniref:Uncharacterized protein n=1 Tax=Pradoshia eiseniae TaxID=2064768 RepID=A0A2S7N3I8_9BACI|nr:hypothetical protein [Pradoshia eiseniae]PQD96594.1 hypothetical protein CYL18_01475 [Pradoshia eiseniae]